MSASVTRWVGAAAVPHSALRQHRALQGIFDAYGSVLTKGQVARQRFALGAVFVFQLALQDHWEAGADLRVGLKAFLKAA
jgi:hypothetical protein